MGRAQADRRHTVIRVLATIACALASAWASAATIPLGVVFADENVPGTLLFTNPGPQEAFLLEATSDCPCLTVQAEPAPLPAGQSRRLPYVYFSKNTGRFVVQVSLHDQERKVVGTHTVTGFVAQRSWVIRATELLAKPEAVVVDLRIPTKFAQARLPRSLNLQAFALKSHKEWKNRTLILVDEGHDPTELMAEVAALRAAGFGDVRALDGGVAAWARQGGPLEGTADLPVQIAQISPSQFARSQAAGRWRVIEVSPEAAAAFPDAEVVARWTGLESLLGQLPKPPPGALPQRTLVIAPDLETYAHIEKRFGALDTAGLFYLLGGSRALQQFRSLQAAIVPGSAPTATTHTRTIAPASRSGCGVCPH